MLKLLIPVLALLSLTTCTFAVYILQRQDANALYKRREFDKAFDAFRELLEVAESDVQKSDAREMAAKCGIGPERNGHRHTGGSRRGQRAPGVSEGDA